MRQLIEITTMITLAMTLESFDLHDGLNTFGLTQR